MSPTSGADARPRESRYPRRRGPAPSLMTSDVRDVQKPIVRFDTANSSLIWLPTAGAFLDTDRRHLHPIGSRVPGPFRHHGR